MRLLEPLGFSGQQGVALGEGIPVRQDACEPLDPFGGIVSLRGGVLDLPGEVGAFEQVPAPRIREFILRGRKLRQGGIALAQGLSDRAPRLGAGGLHAPCAVSRAMRRLGGGAFGQLTHGLSNPSLDFRHFLDILRDFDALDRAHVAQGLAAVLCAGRDHR